ncbi:MAG: hypothetical protein KDD64_05380 [Bdellovibrionales bacterium]|nr:hypothetical protein [Bdellovibrionales bacterium]
MQKRALTPALETSFSSSVERLRELPVPGEVLVKPGDKVSADTIVARASLQGELYILRLPERMGLEAFEVMAGIKVSEGDVVQEGDILCQHAGLFGLLKTVSRSPAEGTIEFIAERTGHLGLRLAAKELTLEAFFDGVVAEVHEGKGLTLKTQGALIQGIFGVGGEARGELCALSVKRDELIQASALPNDIEGKIVYGGSAPDSEVLKAAAEKGAKGFICGSIDDRVLAHYLGYDLGIALTGDEEVPMTVIITEGFGRLAFSERAEAVLSRLSGQTASITGKTQVRAGAVRPEIIIPHEFAEKASEDHQEKLTTRGGLEVGASIRIIRVPYFGKKATVLDLPHAEAVIETGAKTRILTARLEDGTEVTVPRANVELLAEG